MSDVLSTERLRLRSWREADLDAFAELNADPRVMRYFPALLSRVASDALAARIGKLLNERGWGLWAVEAVGIAPFIGFVGLHVPTAGLPFNPCVEVGWRLAFEQWGKGYATEAAHAALRFGFEQLALDEIVSFASLINLRSQAVMSRLGMRRQAETFAYPGLSIDSPLSPHVLYRLSRGDWRTNALGIV